MDLYSAQTKDNMLKEQFESIFTESAYMQMMKEIVDVHFGYLTIDQRRVGSREVEEDC